MLNQNRFKNAMLPASLMGGFVNAYMLFILIYVEGSAIYYSPIISGILFLLIYRQIKKEIISATSAFICLVLIASIEVYIHTAYLGYNSGVGLFLLPIIPVALLNAHWKKWELISLCTINGISIFLLYWIFKTQPAYIKLDSELIELLFIFNSVGTGIVLFVVLMYFSSTISKGDKELLSANFQLEKKNQQQIILLKEVHHRVKNNLQIVSSLMSLQENTLEDTKAIKVLQDSQNRIRSMALIHNKLYQDTNLSRVNFKSYVEDLLANHQTFKPQIKCNIIAKDIELNLDIAVPMGLILSELITNSFKHAFQDNEDGEISVTLNETAKYYSIKITDNGVGLPNNFSLKNSKSLGCEIIQTLTEQIDGQITFWNEMGANFELSIPTKY